MAMEDGPEQLEYQPWIRLHHPHPIRGLCPGCGSSRRGSRQFSSNTFPDGVPNLMGWECTVCDVFGYDQAGAPPS